MPPNGVEWLLTRTIRAGQKSGAIDKDSVKRVAVDTTVMEKAIAHPTDSRLYERAREQLVALARGAGASSPRVPTRSTPCTSRMWIASRRARPGAL